MDKGKILGRSMSFPPRVDHATGRIPWSEGEDNVRESIRIILMTEPGERLRLHEFGGGLSEALFEPNTITTRQLLADRIAKVVTQWEPRVVVEAVTVDVAPDDPQSAIATLTYKLIATQARERVRLNVALAS